jgi:hypothetical protein
MPTGIGLRVSPPRTPQGIPADGEAAVAVGEDGLCDFDKLSRAEVRYLRSGNRLFFIQG